jgi:hypothetical protein
MKTELDEYITWRCADDNVTEDAEIGFPVPGGTA